MSRSTGSGRAGPGDRGGHGPAEWVRHFARKVTAADLKDRAEPGEAGDEDGWADLGFGEVDFTHILPALNDAEVERWVLEHDPPSDHERFATRSFIMVAVFAF